MAAKIRKTDFGVEICWDEKSEIWIPYYSEEAVRTFQSLLKSKSTDKYKQFMSRFGF